MHDPSNSTQPKKKANLKKISKQGAQNQAQAQDTKMLASNVEVGKRPGTFESLEFEEIESKNAPSMLPPPPPQPSLDGILTVAAMQHRQEQ